MSCGCEEKTTTTSSNIDSTKHVVDATKRTIVKKAKYRQEAEITSTETQTQTKQTFCSENKVTGIGRVKVGDTYKVYVIMDNCLYHEVPENLLDPSTFNTLESVLIDVKLNPVTGNTEYYFENQITEEQTKLELAPIHASSSVHGAVRLLTLEEALNGGESISNATFTRETFLALLRAFVADASNLPKATTTQFGVTRVATEQDVLGTNEDNINVVVNPTVAKYIVRSIVQNPSELPSATIKAKGVVKVGAKVSTLGGESLGYLISTDFVE